MTKLADAQRFMIWVCGSVAAFGCIATLVAYAFYTDPKLAAECAQNDENCKQNANATNLANEAEVKILRIVSPAAIVVGIFMIIGIRCWQQASIERSAAVEATRGAHGGQNNIGYNDANFDMGAPPSYTDALGMDIVLEAHGSFPVEPPPKYEEVQIHVEGPSRTGEPGSDASSVEQESHELEEITSMNSGALQNEDCETVRIGDECSVSMEDGRTPQNETAVNQNDGDVNNEESLPNVTQNINELDGINEVNSYVVQYYNVEQNAPSNETRIFVRQRDSNLSADCLVESPTEAATQDGIPRQRPTAFCSNQNSSSVDRRKEQPVVSEEQSLPGENSNSVVCRSPRSSYQRVNENLVENHGNPNSSQYRRSASQQLHSNRSATAGSFDHRSQSAGEHMSVRDSCTNVTILSDRLDSDSSESNLSISNRTDECNGVFFI